MAKKKTTKKTARKRVAKKTTKKKSPRKKTQARKKTARKRVAKKTTKKKAPRKKTPARRKTILEKYGIPADFEPILEAIPNYSSIETAHPGHRFDPKLAEKYLDFFPEFLVFTKGRRAGDPFELELWQQAIVANLFGWVKPDGLRRYDEFLLWIARKNGKTTLGSGIGLELLFVDQEEGGEIYSAAADAKQAAIIFDIAKRMIDLEPELSSRARTYARSIHRERTDSVWKVESRNPDSKDGRDALAVLFDELHAIKDQKFIDVLETSVGARDQPVTGYMTTADDGRASPSSTKYDYAKKVIERIIDAPNFLPIIYEVPLDLDWTDERHWHLANPNLGVSIRLEYLRKECKKALEMPTREAAFRRLHLNQRIDSDVRWLPMELWDALDDMPPLERLVELPVAGGLDLGSTGDISAFVLVFMDEDGDDRRFYALAYFWAPADNARAREKSDRVPYKTWADQGHIELTDGAATDQKFIFARILELAEQFPNLKRIAFDRWGSAWIRVELEQNGFDMFSHGQGFRDMSAPSKRLEELILRGDFGHGGNPVMRWMASNVVVETDPAENIKPNKKKSSEKIDGIVSLVMGIAMAEAGEEPTAPSVYEERGLREF